MVENESTNDSLTFCGNGIYAKTLALKLRPKMLLVMQIQKVDIQFIMNKLMLRLSVYKIHLCQKAAPIPLLHFLYHFKGFSELRTERQNRNIVAIAKAPLGDIFI